MQINKLEDLIGDMELIILQKESELDYLKDAQARFSIITGDDKQQADDKIKLENIAQAIPQKEEELKSMMFVTGKYAERLAKERSATAQLGKEQCWTTAEV